MKTSPYISSFAAARSVLPARVRRAASVFWPTLAVLLLLGAQGCRPSSGDANRSAPASAEGIKSPSAATQAFEDVYPSTGIDFVITKPVKAFNILEGLGHGGAMLDADGDGLQDILLLGPDRVALYKNLGNFRFKDITAGSGLRQTGYWCGVAVGDYDNDGKPDIYVCGYNCSALYHNLGGGRFEEVTKSAGVETAPVGADGVPEWRTSAGFIDMDNDGRLDLYVCRYTRFGPHEVQLCGDAGKAEQFSCSPDIYTPQVGVLYRNLGGGKFRDVTAPMGLAAASGRALGLSFADVNDDGWMDIALANDERPGDLFVNQGGKRFVSKGMESGTAVSANGHAHGGMGMDWADYDGDGKLDLFVATYANETKCLYQNMGHTLFADASVNAGLSKSTDPWVAFGCKFLDYDLDGSPDLMIANGHIINNTEKVYAGTHYRQPVQLFHNEAGNYVDATNRIGPYAARPAAGRALIAGDLNNAGKTDVVITQLEGPPLILKNTVHTANHWIGIELEGTRGSRDGFGARVTVTAQGRRQVRDSSNSGSFLSAHDPRLLFGLGGAGEAEAIEVRWPGGQRQTWHHLVPDRYYHLREGTASAAPLYQAAISQK